MTLSRFALTLVIGLSSGMLTYLMAAGMSLIISGMGIINFGQGAFYILGAYVCNQIFTAMGLPFGLALLGRICGYRVAGRCAGAFAPPCFWQGYDLFIADHNGSQLHHL